MSMFGIEDPYIWSAYLLCILSAALCVIYGLITWNRGGEDVKIEDIDWVKEEQQIEEEL